MFSTNPAEFTQVGGVVRWGSSPVCPSKNIFYFEIARAFRAGQHPGRGPETLDAVPSFTDPYPGGR